MLVITKTFTFVRRMLIVPYMAAPPIFNRFVLQLTGHSISQPITDFPAACSILDILMPLEPDEAGTWVNTWGMSARINFLIIRNRTFEILSFLDTFCIPCKKNSHDGSDPSSMHWYMASLLIGSLFYSQKPYRFDLLLHSTWDQVLVIYWRHQNN